PSQQDHVLEFEELHVSEAYMTRAVAIRSAALLAATLGVAQDTSQSGTTGTQNTPSTSTPSTPDQSSTSSTSSQSTTSTTDQSSQSTQNTMSSSGQNTTIQVCLSASAMSDNNFTRTQDQTGTVYTLTGNTADLKSHVGHEVSISGQAVSGNAASANTSSGAPSSSTGSSASANAGGNTLQVSSVQMISDHCAAGANPSSGPRAGAGAGPTTPAIAAGEQPGKTGAPSSTRSSTPAPEHERGRTAGPTPPPWPVRQDRV